MTCRPGSPSRPPSGLAPQLGELAGRDQVGAAAREARETRHPPALVEIRIAITMASRFVLAFA
jgi:hypothetical protein